MENLEPGADASPAPTEEPEVLDLAEVEAESKKDAPVEAVEEESEAESPPAVEEDDEEKTDPFQERIDTLTKRYRETERSLTQLEQENADLREKLQAIPITQEPPKGLADFDYDEGKYRDYLFTEAQSTARQVAREEIEGFQHKQQSTVLEDRYADAEKAFAETVDDFQKKVYDPSLKISQDMATEIRYSDIGPEIAYYLANNPDEATEISKLSGREVTRRMVTLETTLQAEKSKTSEKVSKAPPPPAKIKATDPGFKVSPTDPKSDSMTDEQWFAAEEKRLAKLRG